MCHVCWFELHVFIIHAVYKSIANLEVCPFYGFFLECFNSARPIACHCKIMNAV